MMYLDLFSIVWEEELGPGQCRNANACCGHTEETILDTL